MKRVKQALIDPALVAEVMSRQGWADIGQLTTAVMESLNPEMRDVALGKAVKAEVRRLMKDGRLRDAAGNPIEVASIVTTVREPDGTEKIKRVYKQEMLFDVGDCIQTINYWRGRKEKCVERIGHYKDLAVRLHGPQVQGLLPLED